MNIENISVSSDLGLISLGLAFAYTIFSIFAAFWGARKKRFDWIVSARNATVFVLVF